LELAARAVDLRIEGIGCDSLVLWLNEMLITPGCETMVAATCRRLKVPRHGSLQVVMEESEWRPSFSRQHPVSPVSSAQTCLLLVLLYSEGQLFIGFHYATSGDTTSSSTTSRSLITRAWMFKPEQVHQRCHSHDLRDDLRARPSTSCL
jgi:hypothetical protein